MLRPMTSFLRLPLLVTVLLQAAVHATPADAERVKTSFKADMEKWTLAVNAAATPDARTKAWSTRPDPAVYGRRMWNAISPALDQEWVLDPLAWFIGLTINLQSTAGGAVAGAPAPDAAVSPVGPAFARELDAAGTAVATYHMRSPKLAPVCLAYASGSDPRSLMLLEKIESGHAAKTVQGVAALAIAMRLRSIGDDRELMSKRLKLLRKAIIESADVEINGISMAKLTQDEIYVIRYLTKGRVAPELVGVDSGSRSMKLSDHRGKIVVLVFWNSGVADVVRLLEFTKSIRATYPGGKLAVVGVNNDTLKNLRSIQQTDADLLDFPNFSDPGGSLAATYRVSSLPVIFVLDGERKIQYVGAPGAFVKATIAALMDPVKPGGAKVEPRTNP